jgi:hypothetical protein
MIRQTTTLAALLLLAACAESPTQSATRDVPRPSFSNAASQQTQNNSYSVAVAVEGWQGTGFEVKNGVSVSVSATGLASCGSTPCDGGPTGACPPWLTGCIAPAGFLVEGGVPFGLYARVGSGSPVFIGAGPTTLTGSGELSFGYNDLLGTFGDNSGGFSATVSYACKPGNGNGDRNHYHCGPPGQN